MKVDAKGILRHQFFGTYSAVIGLQFANADDASAALPVLGEGWRVGEKNPEVLVWSGDSESLEKCSDLLESFGADRSKIASLKTSVDYGEWFYVTIPIQNKDQLALF